MNKYLLLVAVATSMSCNQSRVQQPKINQIKTIAILGNSITFHPPKPELGWTGNWGMAATVQDSDFVHLLMADLNRTQPGVKVQYKAIVDFERNFTTYDLHQLDSMRGADMIIMRISENVDPKKAVDSGFLNSYNNLVHYLNPQGKAVIVVTNGFIKNQVSDDMVQEYASANGLQFIDLSTLKSDSTNMALAYKDSGVRLHPSNKGMRGIEQAIWSGIKPYFKAN